MAIRRWMSKVCRRNLIFVVLVSVLSTFIFTLSFLGSTSDQQHLMHQRIVLLGGHEKQITSVRVVGQHLQKTTREAKNKDNIKRLSDSMSREDEERKPQIPAWKLFEEDLETKTTLYNPEGDYFPRLLHELATTEIKNITTIMRGTQLKFWIHFVDGNQAIAKPMRDPKELYMNYTRHSDFLMERERHTAEIAAFHLDRNFDFRRVAPCVGRSLNFTSEILMKTKDPSILTTLTIKDGNQCFAGNCTWRFLCNDTALTCAKDGFLEIAVCQAVRKLFHERAFRYRWVNVQAKSDRRILRDCDEVKKDFEIVGHDFDLDFMEAVALDHLMVNQDRHSYKFLKNTKSGDFKLALLDNGKGFGNPLVDDPGFLSPFRLCCRFRNSSYWKFKEFTKPGQTIGDRMRASLSSDPIYPVLTEDFFPALDRRLLQVLSALDKCIAKLGRDAVLLEK